MKKQLSGFTFGVFFTLFLVASIGTAAATVGTRSAELAYNNIKVTLDGVPVSLVDAVGNPVEPFIIDGTTYLPIRAISNAFGLNVGWDATTQTVILTHSNSGYPSQSQGSSTNAGSVNGNSSGGGSGNADNFYTWDNPDQQNTTNKWVLNTGTMKIHYPHCPDVSRIAPHNYTTSNLSESELILQGYTTCGRCH